MSKSNCFSAASSNSPFESLDQPISAAVATSCCRDNCAVELAFLDRTRRALRLGNCQAFFGEREYREHLLAIHPRKPVEKLIDRRSGFQIFKKGFHRDPRVFESPGATQRVCGTLHRGACTPIHHATRLSFRGRSATGPSSPLDESVRLADRTGTMSLRWWYGARVLTRDPCG